ncbi:MAG: tripartite tricarboxylate transporter substrate binding protein [Methylibium sp.]|nr:tripartite tricarboxylate transporter substrate binding protein [Methylibium sp.]
MSEQHPDHPDFDRRRVLAAAAGTAVAVLAGPSFAQSFPTHPIRMVVPFPAGGPTDIVARPIAAMLSEALGQQVIVDNRGGAGGSIGADIVAKAPPDGYTILMGTVGTHAINPSLYRKLPYDPVEDFTALGLVASAPVAIVVHPSAPYKSVAELIAAAKREPGSINFGSAGNGTPGHLTGEMFAKAAGVEFKHVPYKGSAPALNDLLGAQIPLMFDPVQSVLQHVRAGKLRALAVSSRQRSPVLEQTASVSEAGLKDFEATAWWALFAPAGLPAEIRTKLSNEIKRIVASDAYGKHLIELGVEPAVAAKQSFAEFQKAELEKWGRAVRESGVSLG